MKQLKANVHSKRFTALLLAVLLAAAVLLPLAAKAEEEEKVVRVGWFESPFYMEDSFGRRSGYAYEYQTKIAAYTDWTYEYVEGSWPELMELLQRGEIDLMADVSYTEERAEQMLFPFIPMGEEDYCIFIAHGNTEITPEDYSTLNGKKVGVNKGSIQADMFRSWAEKQNVQVTLIELTVSESASQQMLQRGELDALIYIDGYLDAESVVPICKIGSSDYYFAVSKSRPDLLSELDAALNRIMEENRFYNKQLFDKYVQTSTASLFLKSSEKAWLAAHGPIRVGYQDNYLAFCAADASGELTGALKDYLSIAADCLANVHLDFTVTAYPTVEDALDALNRGEIDCVFPANFTVYDADRQGLLLTAPVMTSEMDAVVRESDQQSFSKLEKAVVAVNRGNLNYELFMTDNFPDWEMVFCDNTEESLKAVADGDADCVVISSYRFGNIARICEKLRLTTVPTDVEMTYCFTVRKGETELYSILSRTVGAVSVSAVNASLTYYSTEDAKLTFLDVLEDNLPIVLTVIIVILLVFVSLLLQNVHVQKQANEEQRLISATESDELTGLYNRGFFVEYANRMYREHPEKPMNAFMLNIERFHSVNELNGRDFGDHALCVLADAIREALQGTEGIASRFEADQFGIYCAQSENEQALFDRLQRKLDTLSPNANIRLRMGMMRWQEGLTPAQMFERARIACGMARGQYHTPLVVFDESIRKRERLEQRLLNDLHRAVENREFEVHYQPKYDIQSEPPRLKSAEALVRWRHPELGMIPPNDFIPLFERSRQIEIVDRYVWAEAARQIALWRDQYGVTIPISVNLSRIDAFDPELESILDGLVETNGLERSALNLEVTESACTVDAEEVIRVIERLRQKGYAIEMDDFGVGYSSLNMLSSMPIDVLKMDRAFIRNIEHDEKDLRLVELILNIARDLKVPVVAEGVETEPQMQLLKKMGCALVQGYYFSRPLPATAFETTILEKIAKQ